MGSWGDIFQEGADSASGEIPEVPLKLRAVGCVIGRVEGITSLCFDSNRAMIRERSRESILTAS